MKIITIEIPNDVEEQLNLLGEDNHAFILEAIKEKINRWEFLKNKLEEGYKATFQEDREISNDFEFIDIEEWK
jgi:predicted transcriptional regulator